MLWCHLTHFLNFSYLQFTADGVTLLQSISAHLRLFAYYHSLQFYLYRANNKIINSLTLIKYSFDRYTSNSGCTHCEVWITFIFKINYIVQPYFNNISQEVASTVHLNKGLVSFHFVSNKKYNVKLSNSTFNYLTLFVVVKTRNKCKFKKSFFSPHSLNWN